jgi:hypothetical protein
MAADAWRGEHPSATHPEGGRTMKIVSVAGNNRRHLFEVHLRGRDLVLPYSKVDPIPSASDRLAEVFVDPELGREGFTYKLRSGKEGSVHIDSVLEYNEDPSYLAELTMYRLTQAARERFDASELSAREISRRLGTSPAQLYRLLDPTNYAKSLRQLFSLLHLLGYEIDVEVKDRSPRPLAS